MSYAQEVKLFGRWSFEDVGASSVAQLAGCRQRLESAAAEAAAAAIEQSPAQC
jgi:hypothetical protein